MKSSLGCSCVDVLTHIYRIIEAEVEFPSNIVLPEDCKDIIQQLCTKDSSARLGNLRGGSEDVKNHPFFSDIDWDELEKKSELV